MQNYYEILQVDKNASNEMIEKAYKLLAKKYHPDMQPKEKRQWAEEKFKMLNEAYSTLSNSEKRADYDKKFKIKDNGIYERYEKLLEQNKVLKSQLEYFQAKFNSLNNPNYINVNNVNNVNIDNTRKLTDQIYQITIMLVLQIKILLQIILQESEIIYITL